MKTSKIVRAITCDGSVRLFVTETRAIVQKAHEIHDTSKTVTAALGRALTGASLMGCMLKDKEDSLTLNFKCDGPVGSIFCISDYSGNVKGYVGDPSVELPPNALGKLDVGGAVGGGKLYVAKYMKGSEPYVGLSDIVSGEIAEDITNYFAVSEQTPTACALGVRCDTDNNCKSAGGYLLQLLPGADEATVSVIERNINLIPSVSEVMLKDEPCEFVIKTLFSGLDFEVFDEFDTDYVCNCKRASFEKALISVGKNELEDMISENKDVEMNCVFCNKKQVFTPAELKLLEEKAKF